MWSTASHYSSTPHLFVYQPCGDDDVETEPSDSGYADSTRSGGTTTSSSAGGETSTPEPIYYSTTEFAQYKQRNWGGKEMPEEHKYNEDDMDDMDDDDDDDDEEKRKRTTAAATKLQLTELEMMRVETFFRGNQTQVFVGKSLVNLYLRTAKSLVGLNRCSSQPDVCSRTLQRQHNRVTDWQLKFTGIPVVLLDMGATRSRDQRRIQLIVAERGTGFTLWRDTIDNLSNYEAADATFHTMRLSTDHRDIAGLSFDSPEAAHELFRYIETLTSDPANVRLSAPKTSRTTNFLRFFSTNKNNNNNSRGGKPSPSGKKHPGARGTLPLPRKSDISQPCFFQHVTSVDSTDRGKLFSMQTLVPQ